jgi:NitT/TauT family transport system substrate-binding protein
MAQVPTDSRDCRPRLGSYVIDRRTALAAGAAFVAAPRWASAQSNASLHVIGPPNDGFKAVYYGVKAGIFKRHGVDVEVSLINSGAAAAAALIGGTADVAYTNITTLILAHNKGVPIQILAPGAVFDSDNRLTTAIIVLKDGPIRSGLDLDGKTVGSVSLGDTMAASIQAWVDQNGGHSQSLKIIEVPASAAVETLQAGRVSAAAMNEPAVTQALAGGNARALGNPNAAIAKRFMQAMFAVMGPVATAKSDAVVRFAQAMHEASAYTNTHMPETIDLVAGYSGIAPDVVARSARFIDGLTMDPTLIQPVIDVLVKYGITSPNFPAAQIISSYALKP